MPGSRWPRSPPTSSACRAAPCSRPWSKAQPIRPCWRIWRGRLRKKLPALHQALAGRFRPHHAFLVGQLLGHLDYLDEAIAAVSEEVDSRLAPFAPDLARLDTIPGVNKRTAEVSIAELGV